MSPEKTSGGGGSRGTEVKFFVRRSEKRRFDIALATSGARVVEEQLLPGGAKEVVLRKVYGDFWGEFLGKRGE